MPENNDDLFDWTEPSEEDMLKDQEKKAKKKPAKKAPKKPAKKPAKRTAKPKVDPTTAIKLNELIDNYKRAQNRLNNIEKQIANIREQYGKLESMPIKSETQKELIKMFRYAMTGRKAYLATGVKDTAEFEALFVSTLYKI